MCINHTLWSGCYWQSFKLKSLLPYGWKKCEFQGRLCVMNSLCSQKAETVIVVWCLTDISTYLVFVLYFCFLPAGILWRGLLGDSKWMEGKTWTFQDWGPEMGPLSCDQELDDCTNSKFANKNRGVFERVCCFCLFVVFSLKLFRSSLIFFNRISKLPPFSQLMLNTLHSPWWQCTGRKPLVQPFMHVYTKELNASKCQWGGKWGGQRVSSQRTRKTRTVGTAKFTQSKTISSQTSFPRMCNHSDLTWGWWTSRHARSS